MEKEIVYCAVRLTEAREWLNVTTCRLLPESSRLAAEIDDRENPGYAGNNPVQRIAQCQLVEVDPGNWGERKGG